VSIKKKKVHVCTWSVTDILFLNKPFKWQHRLKPYAIYTCYVGITEVGILNVHG